MERELLDKFVEDTTLFKKALKECDSKKDLYNFLKVINCGGYKIYVKNKWEIPLEEIEIYEDGNIRGYFYMNDSREYKTIEGFIKAAELIKSGSSYDKFTVSYYPHKEK